MPRNSRSSAALLACSATAAAQHGLLTREQALEAGLARWTLDDEIGRGLWIRMRPGVYRSATSAVTWQQRALATCIGKTRALAVSHRSAAFLHGLLDTPPGTVEVLAGYGAPVAGLEHVARVHRVRRIPSPGEVETLGGLPVTSLARTLVDLANRTPRRQLEELVDRAVQSRRSEGARSGLVRSLEESAAGRRGATALREAMRPWTTAASGAAQLQSVLEAQVLRLLARAYLPTPTLQHEVLVSGERYCLDFAWPARMVALEVDGFAYHSDRRAFSYDRLRGNKLLTTGWRVLHTTSQEIRQNSEQLVGAVRVALGL